MHAPCLAIRKSRRGFVGRDAVCAEPRAEEDTVGLQERQKINFRTTPLVFAGEIWRRVEPVVNVLFCLLAGSTNR